MMPMPLNPMMSQAMHPPIQGGDDSTMIFIIVIMFCCSIFCAFIYFYIQQENAEEEEDACIQHTESVSCSADTSCSWNTDTFLCSKVGGGGGVTKCSVEEHVLSGECKPCPTFPNGSFSMKSPGEVVLKDADDTTCSVKQPCPENYHVSSGSCVACGSGLIRDAGDDPNLSDTECKRGKCRNNQRIECSDSCSEGTCCCVDCPSGKESSKIHAKSPDDISVSDPQCVEIGQGVSAQLQSPSASATPTLSRHSLCNINQRVNSEGLCEDCVEGETTNNTRHDPTLGETYCDKPNCKENKYAIHTVPGGACGDCIGQETNDGGFSPTDITKGECLKCKNTSYLNENNECTLCLDDMVVNGRPDHWTEPGGESYFKTDLTMVGLDNCKKPLCASNERISCVKDQDDIWSCNCSTCEVGKFSILPHTIHPDDYPPNIPIEVTDNYTSECVDFCGSARHTLIIDNWEKSVEQCEEKGLCTEANCELDEKTGGELNNAADPCSEMKIIELTTLIDDYLDTTGTSELPQTKPEGLEKCSNSPLNNRVQGLKGRLKSIRLSSPCPVNYRFYSESSEDLEDKCVRCDGQNGKIGSYPEGRVENFDPNHQHPRPRSVTTTSTICKKAQCKPGEEISCIYPNCNENTSNPEKPTCSSCPPATAPKLTSGLPYGNNGNHQISISDAEYKDVTVCRDPDAIVATCGNTNGLGETIADRDGGCGNGYTPVTGAGLETVCEGSECDLTRDPVRSGDHKKCCIQNETCAGRILYDNVSVVSILGALITISHVSFADILARGDSPNLVGKKFKLTARRDRADNISYTGTISTYTYHAGEHKITVQYDVEIDSETDDLNEGDTIKIYEKLSSSCPTGKISTGVWGQTCVGVNCDFNNQVDLQTCCKDAPEYYAVSPTGVCSDIGLHPINESIEECYEVTQKLATEDRFPEFRDWESDQGSPGPLIYNGLQPFEDNDTTGQSPLGCWWWSNMGGHSHHNTYKRRINYNTNTSGTDTTRRKFPFKKAICKGTFEEGELSKKLFDSDDKIIVEYADCPGYNGIYTKAPHLGPGGLPSWIKGVDQGGLAPPYTIEYGDFNGQNWWKFKNTNGTWKAGIHGTDAPGRGTTPNSGEHPLGGSAPPWSNWKVHGDCGAGGGWVVSQRMTITNRPPHLTGDEQHRAGDSTVPATATATATTTATAATTAAEPATDPCSWAAGNNLVYGHCVDALR